MTKSDLSCDCLGGGTAYVAHGEDVVLLAFTEDVDWWRNAVAFAPSEARRLAAILNQQADRSDAITEGAVRSDAPSGVHKPFTDDGVTYCGWDGHEGCGEVWPCKAVTEGAET